jgi:hypothetical protein
MGADKSSSQRSNSAYAPNSQPRIPTRVCQARVVTMDLPTLGTNPKQTQSESESQEAKDLAPLRSLGGPSVWRRRTVRRGRWTVRKHRVDRPKIPPELPVLHLE